MRIRHPILPLVPLLLVVALFAACGDDDDDAESVSQTPTSTAAAEASGSITVFAASSLTDAFGEMATAFSDANADAEVTFNFGGSQDLRTQLEQGASADVFASANAKQIDAAVESGVAAEPSSIFARNRLVIIVPKDNPANMEMLQDLANPGAKIVLANADVPVGQYCRTFLENASADPAFGADYGQNVSANVVSEETNVKQVVSKVQLGEADAGCVYTTDVTASVSEDIAMIDIPDALNVIAEYPISLTADPANSDTAQAWIAFVLSDEGQAILESYGFMAAEP